MYFNLDLIICLDNYIDIKALENMQVHHIEKLLSFYPLGILIKFETSLKLWQKTLPQNSNSFTKNHSCDTSTTSSTLSIP
jgi:hypothetical protein